MSDKKPKKKLSYKQLESTTGLYSITELQKEFGITRKKILIYEEAGLIKAAGKSASSGYRYFDEIARERLRTVLIYRELKYPISEIGKILNNPNCSSINIALDQIKELEKQKTEIENRINSIRFVSSIGLTNFLQITSPSQHIAEMKLLVENSPEAKIIEEHLSQLSDQERIKFSDKIDEIAASYQINYNNSLEIYDQANKELFDKLLLNIQALIGINIPFISIYLFADALTAPDSTSYQFFFEDYNPEILQYIHNSIIECSSLEFLNEAFIPFVKNSWELFSNISPEPNASTFYVENVKNIVHFCCFLYFEYRVKDSITFEKLFKELFSNQDFECLKSFKEMDTLDFNEGNHFLKLLYCMIVKCMDEYSDLLLKYYDLIDERFQFAREMLNKNWSSSTATNS